jgi:hypothetical protein
MRNNNNSIMVILAFTKKYAAELGKQKLSKVRK